MQLVLRAADTDALLRAAVAGDEAAFDALVGPHVDLAFRLAAAMLGDRAEAEDAVQEATVKAWRGLPRLRPGSTVRAWYLTIVTNHCRSVRRTRWFGVVRVPEVGRAPVGDPTAGAAERTDLERALGGLPAADRAALFLRYHEDLALDDVAALTGASVPAVRSRIHRALARLRLELDDLEVNR